MGSGSYLIPPSFPRIIVLKPLHLCFKEVRGILRHTSEVLFCGVRHVLVLEASAARGVRVPLDDRSALHKRHGITPS